MAKSEVRLFSGLGAAKLTEIADSNDIYTDFLKFQGRIFKQSASVALEFYAQKPTVIFIATEKQWAASGYRIMDGGEAIHFTDEDGNHSDLYDFSQIEGDIAPRLWSINVENVNQFKAELGVSEDAPLIKSVIEQTVKKSSVIDCMEALEIPPNEFEPFKNAYFGAIQTIIAGRFEIGGNKFNINPDFKAFQALSDTQKIHFLTMVSNTARTSLLKVENIANELATKNSYERNEENERKEKNDTQGVGELDGRTAGQRTGEPVTGDSEGGITERSDSIKNDTQERREVLGNHADVNRGQGNNEAVRGVQAEGHIGNADVVQVRPGVGDVQDEPHGHGTVDGRGTDRTLRDGMAGIHEGASPSLSRGNENEAQPSDSSQSGGRESVGISGTAGQAIRADLPSPDELRGRGEVGENENVPHGLGSDEGESLSGGYSTVAGEPPVANSERTQDKLDSINENTQAPADEAVAAPRAGVSVSNVDELRVGDLIESKGKVWSVKSINGGFRAEFVNLDSNDNEVGFTFLGKWKEKLQAQGFKVINGDMAVAHLSANSQGEGVSVRKEQTAESRQEARRRKKIDPNQLSLWGDNELEPEADGKLKVTINKEHGQMKDVEVDDVVIYENPHFEVHLDVTDTKIVTDELMRGSHFQGGKFRIEEFAKAELTKEKPDFFEFAKFLRDEYGTGGHSGDDVVDGVDYDSKGFLIRLRDERNIKLSWNNVAKKTLELVKKDEYITQDDIKEAFKHADYVLENYSREPDNADKFYIEKAEEFITKHSHRRPPEVEEIVIEEKPELRVADNGSPAPVFYVDWKEAEYDFDLNLYRDGDIIGYNKNGVECRLGRSGKLTYVSETGSFWGGNEVPRHIYEQKEAYRNGKVTESQVRENYLQYLADYKAAQIKPPLADNQHIESIGGVEFVVTTPFSAKKNTVDVEPEPEFPAHDMFFFDRENNRVYWDEFNEDSDGKRNFHESVIHIDEIQSADERTKAVVSGREQDYPYPQHVFFKHIAENSDTPKTLTEGSEEYEIIAERYRTIKPDLIMRDENTMKGLAVFANECIEKLNAEGREYFKNALEQAVEQSNIVESQKHPYDNYLKVKEQYPKHLVFVRLGDFYEAFGDDAKKICELRDFTLTSRMYNNVPIPMCGIPEHTLDKNVEELVAKGYKIAVIEQDGKVDEIDFDVLYKRESEKRGWGSDSNAVTEKIAEPPAKQYDLGYGDLGNGTSVWNRLEEVNGDYKFVAHISDEYEGGIKFIDKDMPADVREEIIRSAQIFNKISPPTEQKLDEHLENISRKADITETPPLKNHEAISTEFERKVSLMLDNPAYEKIKEAARYLKTWQGLGRNHTGMVSDIIVNKITEFNDDEAVEWLSKVDWNNWQKHMDIPPLFKPTRAEKLYEQFAEMFPQIISGEYTSMRFGNEGDAFEPLTVGIIGGNSYMFRTWYIQNGDVMNDPEFTFYLDHEHKTLTICEYQQDGVPVVGTLYQRVHDDDGRVNKKLLADLERNFAQVLTTAKEAERELMKYKTRDGEVVDLYEPEEIEETITDEIAEENTDPTPELREVLNKFSEKHGFGELNIEPNGRLFETMKDNSNVFIGDVNSPVYGKPHTPETLQAGLEKLEEEKPDIATERGRDNIIKRLGGVTELPKVQDNLPEIVYADNPTQKAWDNISALNEMLRLEDAIENGYELYEGTYNSQEKSDERLAKYSGWGGLPQMFDENNTTYQTQRHRLKEVLTQDEYESARATTINAHYTPQVIIDSMYEAVKNMDLPRNARILEPSCGTGNFIRRMPSYFNEAEVTGVEIDSVTARIARQLNPNARILHTGFEHSNLDNNDFDIALGNVPFGDYKLIDPDYVQDWRIHDAFFRKALDKVAPGGVVAFVTSSGTLDKQNPRIREYLARQAELIGAIRLPNNAFKEAGTKVTADIVFLQKRKTPLEQSEPSPDWCYTAPNEDGLKINSYFLKNPQMLLGKMEKTTHFDMLTCVPHEGMKLKEQLSGAINNLNAKITTEKRDKAAKERAGTIDAVGNIKNFTFAKHTDGKYYYRAGDKMTEEKLKPEAMKQLEALCELRDVTRKLLEMQKWSVSDEQLIPMRDNLNKLYDAYKIKHGELNSAVAKKIFGKDTDYALLIGLENENEETKEWEKADIFRRRTVNPQIEITSAESIEIALQISLDRRGRPDVEYMAELLSREPDDVCNELLEKELAYRDPDRLIPDVPYSCIIERSEYLSGNVRHKLRTAEKYSSVSPDYKLNISALEKVIPEDIKAENISVRMGVPWIDGSDYTKFLKQLAGRSGHSANGDVTYSKATGEFEVSGAKKRDKSGLNINEISTYGTDDFSLYALAEKSLNQRQIVVKVEKPHPTEPDKTVMKTDHKRTKKALEKARIIKEEFKKWIFADPDRREKYEQKYNNTFNCLVGREYDGTKLTFPGMDSEFTMRDHQKNAVARATLGGNSLIAHVVGAGKSAVIFASVMRKKELGLINKACVVVPKALTEQIAKEWRKLYPDARLLTVTTSDLATEEQRKLFTAKVATGSYDAVILSREQFEKIPMSLEHRIEFMRKELDEVEDMLRQRKRENHGRGDPTTKQLELARKRMQARLTKLIDPKSAAKQKDDLLEFEQLGFDFLVADEAHAYKNGFVLTKMTNVAGVTTRESGRAADMQMKCDYFNTQLGDGRILMATGTPVSNSMTELYVMTRYLRPDLLRQAGISRFDDWAATFGNVTTQLEQTAYNTYKLKTRFSEFANLPELMAFYKEFADIKSAASLDLPRPKLKDGKNTIVNVPATSEQKAYVEDLAKRAEAINAGSVHPTDDNFLKITGEARLIGLGNQAVKAMYTRNGENLPPDFVEENQRNGKVDVCVNKVFERWEQSTDTKGVQLIFSDIAVNDENCNFSAYKYIKEELIAKGIPEDEIIFAPKSDAKNREEIFNKINAGEYRVIIASTETLGTGANIQKKLVALHHLDIPWKPSCLEQREGRILRQGNENPEVEILNYVTESTLDSYLYSTVTNKARFIAQILDNDSPARVYEDMDEKVLTYAEIQAVAAGDPNIKKRIETANSLAEMNMLRREWGYERARMRELLEVLPAKLEKAQETLTKIQEDIPGAKKAAAMEELPLDNKRIHAQINDVLAKFKTGNTESVPIGIVAGFEVTVRAVEVTKGATLENLTTETIARITVKGAAEYSFEASLGEHDNNVVRIKNLFTKIVPAREESAASEVTRFTEDMQQARTQINVPFEHEQKIVELEKLLEELDEKLSGISKQEDVIADEDDLEQGETAKEKAVREELYNTDDNDYQPVANDDEPLPPTRKGR